MTYFERFTEGEGFTEEVFVSTAKEALESLDCEGKRVLAIIPDATRTAPMKLFYQAYRDSLVSLTKQCDILIALGTHPPMSEKEIHYHLGVTPSQAQEEGIGIFNHSFDNPDELRLAGTLSSSEMEEISGGLVHEEVPVTVNRRVFSYDHVLLMGPVFPHEVVGFSGGYKYLFPGVSGREITDRFHWFSALITNPKIIGHRDTPVREVLNRASRFIPVELSAFCLVMQGESVMGVSAGDVRKAWSKAADVSASVNIFYKERPFHTIYSMAPPMYTELWVGGKCMYKLEPVAADGGRVIIYAPHIKEVSLTHGRQLREIGYHTRDYFLHQWERFRYYPGSVLAHSTHVKGIGTYRNGVEKSRIEVILATGIPPEVCREMNLGYLDWRTIDPSSFAGREDEGILVVPKAGEMLYRLADGSVPDIDNL